MDTTKRNYKKLPTLKLFVKETENNEDGESEYLSQKLKFYLSEKEYLENHCVGIVQAIVTCYEERYSSLLDNNNENSGVSDDENMEVSDGDSVLFHVYRVLYTKFWPKLQQLNSVKKLFENFNNMEVSHSFSINSLIDG